MTAYLLPASGACDPSLCRAPSYHVFLHGALACQCGAEIMESSPCGPGCERPGQSSGRPENPVSCPSCGSPDRGELYYVAGRNEPVSCSSDWHDPDARGPDDDPHNDQETRT